FCIAVAIVFCRNGRNSLRRETIYVLARVKSTSKLQASSFDTVISKCRLPDFRKADGRRMATSPAPTRTPVAVTISHSSQSRFSRFLSSRLTLARTLSASGGSQRPDDALCLCPDRSSRPLLLFLRPPLICC